MNKVKVLIQKPGESTYEKIKGLKSDLEIDLGGKLGTTLKTIRKQLKEERITMAHGFNMVLIHLRIIPERHRRMMIFTFRIL